VLLPEVPLVDALSQNENMIQALPTDRSQEPFAKYISFRGAVRRFQDFDACPHRDTGELLSEFAIVVGITYVG
jgi:hypothetical protein